MIDWSLMKSSASVARLNCTVNYYYLMSIIPKKNGAAEVSWIEGVGGG
jgi:hypothetical protein